MSCLECCVNVVVLKLDAMFCNITDIYELTVTLLGLVEDMLEMSEEKQVPTIGSCFEELAEVTLSHYPPFPNGKQLTFEPSKRVSTYQIYIFFEMVKQTIIFFWTTWYGLTQNTETLPNNYI